jgi:hypothetical protein
MCRHKNYSHVSVTMAIVVGLLTVGGIGVLYIASWNIYAYTSRHRMCIEASNKYITTGPGDPDGLATGFVLFDVTRRIVEWDIDYVNLTKIESIYVKGPSWPGEPFTGSIHIPLCGAPAVTPCIDTIPNNLVGFIDQLPSGAFLEQVIKETRNNPSRYTIHFNTEDFPNGAIAAPLLHFC